MRPPRGGGRFSGRGGRGGGRGFGGRGGGGGFRDEGPPSEVVGSSPDLKSINFIDFVNLELFHLPHNFSNLIATPKL